MKSARVLLVRTRARAILCKRRNKIISCLWLKPFGGFPSQLKINSYSFSQSCETWLLPTSPPSSPTSVHYMSVMLAFLLPWDVPAHPYSPSSLPVALLPPVSHVALSLSPTSSMECLPLPVSRTSPLHTCSAHSLTLYPMLCLSFFTALFIIWNNLPTCLLFISQH